LGKLFRRLRVRTRRIVRRILRQRDSAARVARGVAGGFFAAAFPLPGLQIPLSLLAAWILRGNKVVSIFPQFISNAGTMLPLAILQYHLGSWFWPAQTADATESLLAAAMRWDWACPWESLRQVFSALGALGANALGPLTVGVLLSGLAMSLLSYPLTIIAVRTWHARRRSRLAKGRRAPALPPLALPGTREPELTCEEALRRYTRFPGQFLRAESVKLLVDGRQAFPEMLAAVDSSRHAVDMETYILRADRTGTLFQQALIRAASRGVRVRLLYDFVGGRGLPGDFLRPMIQAGVSIGVYNPPLFRRPLWSMNHRDHRKVLTVDGRVSFTGGLNIADDYAAPENGGAGWRDTHARLDGAEIATELRGLFEYAWARATPYEDTLSLRARLLSGVRRRLPRSLRPSWMGRRRPAPVPCEAPGVPVKIIGNEEFLYRRRIHRAYMYAINHAQRYILIENAYFIPGRNFRRALRRAARRGVRVAVTVARHSDVAIAAYASRNLYSDLLASGVRLLEWPEGMMHAKTAVVDGAWAIVGSYNFDHRSLVHQLEAVAVVADPAFARELADQMLRDMAKCDEVTLEEHESRPWTRMLLESAAYLLRHWL
jgi:cardiolipin synthase